MRRHQIAANSFSGAVDADALKKGVDQAIVFFTIL